MKHARSLFTLLSMVVMLSPPSATTPQAPAASAEARPSGELAGGPLDNLLEPWRADYPAATELDEVRVYAQTRGQVQDLEWALERYAEAGLELPYLEAWLHDGRSYCDGPVRKGRSGFSTWRHDLPIIFGCGSRHTLLHELGHVYDRHMLTNDDRNAFMALRGVSDWQDDVWLESGQEHLADVLAWALSPAADRHAQTEPRDDASLTAAYELATGLEPLTCEQYGKEGRS